jgi:hypothetical protein
MPQWCATAAGINLQVLTADVAQRRRRPAS